MSFNIKEAILIGEGRVGKVYKLNQRAYKVYPLTHPREWIQYEIDIHQLIKNQTKLNIPSMNYTVDSNVIEMDLIEGVDLTTRMKRDHYKEGLDDLIKLQLTVYQYQNLKLMNALDDYYSSIISSPYTDLKEYALESLKKIKRDDKLCHFDFHPSNIMFDGTNYIIIDWTNVKLGNPVMDIARTYIILKQYAKRLSGKYLRLVIKRSNYQKDEVINALPLMAYMRLLEMPQDEFTKTLIKMIKGEEV